MKALVCLTATVLFLPVMLTLLLLLSPKADVLAVASNNSLRKQHQTSSVNDENSLWGWRVAGPATYVNAFATEDDKKPLLTSSGAVQSIVNSGNQDWFLASVNGGIWKTTPNLDDQGSIAWTNVLDKNYYNDKNNLPGIRCTSMSALSQSFFHPTRLYAGCGGSTSSEQGNDWNVVNSGDWGGLLVSHNAGTTWQMIESFPANFYVTDIIEFDDHNDSGGVESDTTTTTVLLVSAQSNLYDKYEGGIWRSINGGQTFERVVCGQNAAKKFDPCTIPTSTLTMVPNNNTTTTTIVATHVHQIYNNHSEPSYLSVSSDGGVSFAPIANIQWKGIPFYTCFCVLGDGRWVFAGLTRYSDTIPNATDSQFFLRTAGHTNNDDFNPNETNSTKTNHTSKQQQQHQQNWIPFFQPTSMDQDSMPKDRMGLLADPYRGDTFYVAGNAGALVWRVNATSQSWFKLWSSADNNNNNIPHGDCRNMAWDFAMNRLLVVTDGGVFALNNPHTTNDEEPIWVSLNGNYAGLELLSAKYDPNDGRYVMGAQDNCAIVTNSSADDDMGYCFVEGDGAITLVDSSVTPSRLYGTTQFLGVGTIDIDPNTKKRRRQRRRSEAKTNENGNDHDDDDDDDGCGGLCFAQGDSFVEIPLGDYFPDPSCFPLFVHPYTLNVQDPTRLHFWVNQTESAIYEFHIPHSVTQTEHIGPPTKVVETPPGVLILDFVSGGTNYQGVPDPNLIVAISNSHLYVREGSNDKKKERTKEETSNALIERPLPIEFALPVTLSYDPITGERILGPLTHARTVFMEVASSDSDVIVVTGWTTIDNNAGEESVFLTTNAGESWTNITGNLREASGVLGKVRPSGMKLVDLKTTMTIERGRQTTRALLLGTGNGILATRIDTVSSASTTSMVSNKHHQQKEANNHTTEQVWSRFGTLDEYPLVLTMDIDYEPKSDKLVAATFGRGIYVLDNAKEKLIQFFAASIQPEAKGDKSLNWSVQETIA